MSDTQNNPQIMQVGFEGIPDIPIYKSCIKPAILLIKKACKNDKAFFTRLFTPQKRPIVFYITINSVLKSHIFSAICSAL